MKPHNKLKSLNFLNDFIYKSLRNSIIYFEDKGNKSIMESAVSDLIDIPIAESETGSISCLTPLISLAVTSHENNPHSDKSRVQKEKSTYDWANKKILIVEDDDANHLYLQYVLKKTNVKIIRAMDGLMAIRMCKENSDIDLILMDIQLPLMDGYDATIEIRSFMKTVPIFAQTAYAQTTDKDKCFICGCNEFITKPIERNMIIDLINRYFNK